MILRLIVSVFVFAGSYAVTGPPIIAPIAFGITTFFVLSVLAKVHDPAFQADLQGARSPSNRPYHVSAA